MSFHGQSARCSPGTRRCLGQKRRHSRRWRHAGLQRGEGRSWRRRLLTCRWSVHNAWTTSALQSQHQIRVHYMLRQLQRQNDGRGRYQNHQNFKHRLKSDTTFFAFDAAWPQRPILLPRKNLVTTAHIPRGSVSSGSTLSLLLFIPTPRLLRAALPVRVMSSASQYEIRS